LKFLLFYHVVRRR